MLFVERSNRTEILLEDLSRRLMEGKRDPLVPASVVVQGPGMERWLAQSIARRIGVCANVDFLFPQALLDRAFEEMGGPRAELGRPWELGRLVWSVARELAAHRGDPDFAPLELHLEAPDGAWRLVQLARQIAILLDRYATFRPEWLRQWRMGRASPDDPTAVWQARLVRALAEASDEEPFAERASVFLERIDRAGQGTDPEIASHLERAFPHGIEIFAVSTLPPLYLSVLDGLARIVDVHLSILSPTRVWWADLWREVRDADREGDFSEGNSEVGLFASPPPMARLLAGLGRLGGDFQRCLEERSSTEEVEHERYVLSPGDTLLARLQRQILDLEPPGEDERIVRPEDDSIQVHLCHGPRRELEVVFAQLHEAFRESPTLLPEDVIVMAPRIDTIAPDIEAIFGAARGQGAIPHRIADRGALRRSPVAEAFVALLELIPGRATRGEVIDWLAREPVRSRFDLDEASVESVSDWAARAGVRFGLDADHRAALALEPSGAHTWAEGLSRLALAHAVGPSGALYAGLAAESLGPLVDPAVLGALGELEDLLSATRAEAARGRTVPDWCRWLVELLASSCAEDDASAHEHVRLRSQLQKLSENAAAAGFDGEIPFEAIREEVVGVLTSSPAPQAFLAGGVTFCELVPLRAIPFRVVVIVGLSDEAFPRGRPAPGFDLMARAPRAGDRNPRSDDRYLFLEALVSAREKLILTVPGRDVRDGRDQPASIVVTELLEAIDATFASETGAIRDRLIVRHPLQASDPRYFEAEAPRGLCGVDSEAYAGARARRAALAAGGGEARRFLSPGLMESVSKEERGLDLSALVERITHASRFFVRERLRLRLPRWEEGVSELDPASLEGLSRWRLGSALLAEVVAGVPQEEAFEHLAAFPSSPRGLAGRTVLRKLQEEVIQLATVVESERQAEPVAAHETTLILSPEGHGEVWLSGRLDGLTKRGRVEFGFTRLGARSELAAWIHHLFLCVCVEEGLEVAPRTTLVGRPESEKKGKAGPVVFFEQVPAAREELTRLVGWAFDAARTPLPFFLRSSRVFAEECAAGKNENQAWSAAHVAFLGGDTGPTAPSPEANRELETRRLWEGVSPLGNEAAELLEHRFDVLARALYAPLLEARRSSQDG